MAKVKITDEYTAEGRRMKKALEELDKLECFIGFQREDDQEEEDENGNERPNNTDIAAWNELGTSLGIPSRPFIRNTVDLHADEINANLDEMVKQILNGATAEEVLRNMGVYLKGRMQAEITDGTYAPNADITIHGGWMRNKKSGKPFYVKGKKSNHPLMDEGVMRASVNYQIKKKGSF